MLLVCILLLVVFENTWCITCMDDYLRKGMNQWRQEEWTQIPLFSLSRSRRLVIYKKFFKKKVSGMLFTSKLTKFLFKHLIKIKFITFSSFSSINNKHALTSKPQVVQLLLQGSSKVKNPTTHYIWTLWEGVPEREKNH